MTDKWEWVWKCQGAHTTTTTPCCLKCPHREALKIHCFTHRNAETDCADYLHKYEKDITKDRLCTRCGNMTDCDTVDGEDVPTHHKEWCTAKEDLVVHAYWIDKYSQGTYDGRVWVKRSDLPEDIEVREVDPLDNKRVMFTCE